MTRSCCIPNCRSTSNSLPQTHLFTIPNKKFCALNKKKWAEDLEKIILCLRKDKLHIKSLLHKNRATICEKHFDKTCFLKSKFIDVMVGLPVCIETFLFWSTKLYGILYLVCKAHLTFTYIWPGDQDQETVMNFLVLSQVAIFKLPVPI